jgi:hypothetical protein
MNLHLANQVTIAEHWVCPIEYGDYTGLEDFEIKALAEWLSDYPGAVFQWGEHSEYARDAITDLMAQCVECSIYMRSDDETEM